MSLTLTGTPGHNDILGNEKIDTLAKMGAEGSKRAVAYSKSIKDFRRFTDTKIREMGCDLTPGLYKLKFILS